MFFPGDIQIYFEVCEVFQGFGNIDEAVRVAKFATDRFPNDKNATDNLVAILVSAQRIDEVITVYRDIIRKAPDDQEYYFLLADFFIDNQKYDEAYRFTVEDYPEIFLNSVNGMNIQKNAIANKTVEWNEPLLEEIIRIHLNKPQDPIIMGDLMGISGIYIVGYDYSNAFSYMGDIVVVVINGEYTYNILRNLATIEDLKNFSMLKYINLTLHSSTGYDELKNLHYLNEFFALGCGIDNIEFIINLQNLRNLGLSNNIIKDISPIRGLEQLTTLYIDGNPISDYSVLDDMNIPGLYR